MKADRIPVTVLTGFLGSGKTTLLNRILTEQHGQRIAVIENEFGEIGVDQDLVINADEEIFEMNNGCICCTVRGDLIRILGNLARRRDRFDRVVLETTGLADPGPVAQTFFVDDEIKSRFYIDGIITLVDAAHVEQHLDDSDEAMAQIAFADLLVLNKIDLVRDEDIARLSTRLRGINSLAGVMQARMAEVPIGTILDLGGFNLELALKRNPQFLEPEYPFEWGGVFQLEAGEHVLRLEQAPDPSLGLVIWPVVPGVAPGDEAERVFRYFAEDSVRRAPGDVCSAGAVHWELDTRQTPGDYRLRIDQPGHYALFTQHLPQEFDAQLYGPEGWAIEAICSQDFNPGHEHDETVTSVSMEIAGDLDERRVNQFIGYQQRTNGIDIFRLKGVLSFAGEARRIVIQGVHMLLDATEGDAWGDAPRRSRLVFIGRNLDAPALRAAFAACAA
ncbi:MAG: GTP-binding protein [Gammaproteobacteria bacterium]|nr:GTP-binding protein [Gammaproteobacteria bacterium]